MLRTEIKTLTFSESSSILDDICDNTSIRSQAAQLLGYKANEYQESHIEMPPLAAAIANAGVDILDFHDVLLYQNDVMHDVRVEEIGRLEPRIGQSMPWHSLSEWIETELSKYSGYVPDSALDKALKIKQKFPGAEFFIQRLENNPDPFLIVRSAGSRWNSNENYYLAVWDEPGFMKRN